MSDVPTFTQVIDSAAQSALARARVMLPGRIVAYDSVRQSVTVQIEVPDVEFDEDDGTPTVTPIPALKDVPVQIYGGGGCRYTLPLQVGDTGSVIFASSATARWKLTGKVVDPGTDRHHSLADAVFHPGLHDYAHVPTAAPSSVGCLHGPHYIGDASLGDDKYKAVIRATLDQFMTILSGVADAAGACAALHTALQTANWPDLFTATKVRLK